jgi:L-ascorbate metabolism protein UlaG (beta-lactamase superfamily)
VRVELLGSGAGDGWPNPWCRCASCSWARTGPGRTRRQTSALVDDVLLVDAGTALHQERALTDLRTVLFTHAHPDHADPQLLLWRQAAMAAGAPVGPLEIAGPPAALDLCRDWVAPAEPVTWTELRAGDQATLASGHAVRAVPANHWPAAEAVGPALLYVLDERVLLGWDTAAPLPPACRAARYDLVLLDCNDGDLPHSAHHHTLADFAATVGDLRAHGAVHDGTRVVAVSLGHANPAEPRLSRRLAASGAEPGRDGQVIQL